MCIYVYVFVCVWVCVMLEHVIYRTTTHRHTGDRRLFGFIIYTSVGWELTGTRRRGQRGERTIVTDEL
jgi:hypothetical protein